MQRGAVALLEWWTLVPLHYVQRSLSRRYETHSRPRPRSMKRARPRPGGNLSKELIVSTFRHLQVPMMIVRQEGLISPSRAFQFEG